MITLKNKFSLYLDTLFKLKNDGKILEPNINCFDNNVSSLSALISLDKKTLDKMTVGEALDILHVKEENNTEYEFWIMWTFEKIGKEIDTDIRKIFLTKIFNPMNAMRLYLDYDFWTDEEDTILKEKFKGKLPKAEKELELKEVSRKKVST